MTNWRIFLTRISAALPQIRAFRSHFADDDGDPDLRGKLGRRGATFDEAFGMSGEGRVDKPGSS